MWYGHCIHYGFRSGSSHKTAVGIALRFTIHHSPVRRALRLSTLGCLMVSKYLFLFVYVKCTRSIRETNEKPRQMQRAVSSLCAIVLVLSQPILKQLIRIIYYATTVGCIPVRRLWSGNLLLAIEERANLNAYKGIRITDLNMYVPLYLCYRNP